MGGRVGEWYFMISIMDSVCMRVCVYVHALCVCMCACMYAHLAHLDGLFPYLLGVGRVLLLHSFRSRATSWVTPTPVMLSLICWCHVLLGRPRRLAPGITSAITLRVTLFASRFVLASNVKCPLLGAAGVGAIDGSEVDFFHFTWSTLTIVNTARFRMTLTGGAIVRRFSFGAFVRFLRAGHFLRITPKGDGCLSDIERCTKGN